MGKSKKGKPAGKSAERRKKRRILLALALALVLVVSGVIYFRNTPGQQGRSFTVAGGEDRPVLPPTLFPSPRVQTAYLLAAADPELLDHLYCYCHCSRPPFLHKSLLSCYATNHAAG